MTNSCIGTIQDSDGNLITQKIDKENHGFRLKIIADIEKNTKAISIVKTPETSLLQL
jgi:hypothetical protein